MKNFNLIEPILKYAIAVYLLNFFWESWHAAYLYWGHMGKSFAVFSVKEYLDLIGYVSLVDMLLLIAIFLGAVFIWKSWRWYEKLSKEKIIYFVIAAVAVAVWIEIKGVYLLQQWSYTDLMPTVFGLGLSPLFQLATTGLLAILFIKSFSK